MKKDIFNKFVKILLKNKHKIVKIDKIKKTAENLLSQPLKKNQFYKLIYKLKNKGIIISIKKDLFYIKSPSENTDIDEIIDQLYWKILKQKIKDSLLTNKRYIGWIKALELNLQNYNPPESIQIINKEKNSLETILKNKKIDFKNYILDNGKFYIDLTYKFTVKTKIDKYVYPFANIELSILESLYSINQDNQNYIYELVKKILRKKWKKLNFEILEKIVKNNKHHTSINRLYKISKYINYNLAEKIKQIIRQYSYFLDI